MQDERKKTSSPSMTKRRIKQENARQRLQNERVKRKQKKKQRTRRRGKR